MPAKPAKPSRKHAPPSAPDPTTDDALLALPADYAAPPDVPVVVAQQETASLARLATARGKELAKVGVTANETQTLARFATRLKQLETAWQRARGKVKLKPAERKLLEQGEALDTKLLAGGRWACRKDAEAQVALTRIAEGSGLRDTIDDLHALVSFWHDHAAERVNTDITDKDLTRASEIARALEPVAEKEASDADAALALELRNRCFWAADELAKDVREGGRYAFKSVPKIAAKFVARYRLSAVRRSQRKAKQKKGTSTAPAPTGATNQG